jgi:hypothetical protein
MGDEIEDGYGGTDAGDTGIPVRCSARLQLASGFSSL